MADKLNNLLLGAGLSAGALLGLGFTGAGVATLGVAVLTAALLRARATPLRPSW